ncbi:MAG: aminotransferase class V-fold PLP-dependent enzyme [Bacteroidota bacterium]|nr:aminotransferase class V-fold PLP-dependent enzyme [Bacteroidota bacterium]MDP3143794.1 aminotransferase class V-fold PLP-dependent enzyme [Bacteroidota bacterium]
MNSKRNFLKSLLLTATIPLTAKAKNIMQELPEEWTKEEPNDYWQTVRNDYKLKPDYINLENGYYGIMAQPVLEGYLKDLQKINLEGSYYMRTVQFDNKQKSKERLAELVGCRPEELIITRNTTESLDTVISGIDWKQGDEAIMAEQDYGSMLDMFKQQAKRYGMINKIISLPLIPKNDEEIIKLYENAITSKTKLIMVCHMVNITGQILPIKKICDMAHSKGVEVMVDGAHAVSHFDFKISDLNCDYYGSSLHKWLGVPLGVGILYVKKEKIKTLWPLFGEYNFNEEDIRKLNHTGTISVASDIAINHAIDYNNAIGIKRKEERLRFLQNYWTNKIKDVKKIYLNTPTDPNRSCAIANVGIEGIKPGELAKVLLDKYKIWTVAIDSANVHGVRVTPQIFTTTQELDKFVNALIEIAKS